MKKKLLITILISLLCLGLFLTISCSNENDKLTSYAIDSKNFVTVVGLGEKPDLSGLSLIKKENDTEERLEVTPDMVQDYGDTSKAGETNLIITHRGRRFTIPYTVKYRVTFVSDGAEVASQLVLGVEEISFPEVTKENFTFVGWDKELPETLSENMTFVARFEENRPALATLQATYGDTLATLTLPDGINGAWRFVDALDTKVGNVGKNTFAVEFVSSNTGEVSANATVTVEVAKKTLTFDEIVDEFVYDGKEHFPTFTLPYDVEVLPLGDGAQTAVGTYAYGFFINDANYEGMVEGEFEIKKPSITVKVGSYTLVWGKPMPDVQYVVEGFSGDVSVLGISVTMPSPTTAGDYPIVATVSNTNVDATIENGTLTVSVGTIDAGAPPVTMAEVVYGTNLFAIGFDAHPHGTWAWDTTKYDETTLVGDAGEHLFRAVFTPTSSLYEKVSADVKITVTKKTVTIVITDNTFVYDGSAKAPAYRVLDGEKELSSVLATAPSFTDAGSYNVTLTIDDKNYEGAVSGTMTIIQATPEVEFKNPAAVEYRPGLSLSDIVLGAGFTWKTPTTALSAVGVSEYTVIYTPTDKNYKAVEGTVTVTVNKGKASILGFEKEYISTYDGKVYTIPNTYYATNGGAVSVELVGASEMRDAGTYTLRLILAETDLYLGATEELTVRILPRENTDTVNQNQTATYGDTLASLTIPTSDKGVWAFELPLDTSVGNAGVNTFTLKFTSTNPNYLDRTVEVSVTVAKKVLPLPIVANKAYTGFAQTSGLVSDALFTVVEDEGGVAVGAYSVTVELTDKNNYAIADISGDSATITYHITSVENAWEIAPTLSGWTYGDTPATPVAKALYGGYTVLYKADREGEVFTATVPDKAGKYIAKFVTTDENASTMTAEVSFVIEKRAIDVPTLPESEFVYTGTAYSSGLSATDDYTVSETPATVVGTYKVTVTLKDSANYKWNDGATGAFRELTYEIKQATNTFTEGLVVYDRTYGEAVVAPHASALFGNVTILYATSPDGEYSATVPQNAGTYYVKAVVEATANYTALESEALSFTIAKATSSIDAADATFTYGGEAFTITATPSHTESTIVATILFGGSAVEEIRLAGEYTVTFTLPESENYLACEKTVTVVVEKAENTDTVNQNQTATYGDTLASLTIPTSDKGVWAFELPLDTTVGNAGVNTFTLKFTSTNPNYLDREVVITVTVAKRAVAVPEVSHKEYTGEHITSGLTDAEHYIVKSDVGGTELGTYTVILALRDSANYAFVGTQESEITLSYQISVAPNNWAEGKEPSVSSPVIYGDEIVVIGEAVHGGVVVEYKKADAPDSEYSTTKPTAVGTYTVRFTTTDENYTILTAVRTLVIEKRIVEVPTLSGTEFVYTGSAFDLGVASNAIYTVEGVDGVNVGTYTVTFTLCDTDNYIFRDGEGATREASYTIRQAPVTVTTPVLDGWTYGDEANVPSASTSLMANITFLYATEKNGTYTEVVPTKAGTYYVKAVSSGDNTNYAYGESEPVSFTIAKATSSIEAEDSYTFTYDGEVITIVGTPSHNESTIVITILCGGVAVENIVDAGEYTVKMTLAESANYLACEKTVTVTVNKATNSDSLTLSQNATYGDTLADLVLPESTNGVWAFVNAEGALLDGATVLTAGTHTLVAKFFPNTQNYNERTETITVSVAKRKIDTPVIADKTYNATAQTAGIADTALYTVKENAGGTVVGGYAVVLELKDSANYAWAESENATLTLTFRIVKATNEWVSAPTITPSWQYGEAGDNGTAVPKYEELKVVYKVAGADDSTYTATLPTTAGDYVAKFYTEGVNASALSVTLSFRITKVVVELPVLADSDFDYDGAAHSSGLTSNALYTVVDNGGTDSGTYTATLTLVDATNYIWSDGLAGAVRTLNYRIVPTHVDVTMNGTWSGFEYGSYVAPGEILANTDAAHTLALYYATSRDGAYLPYDDSVGASLDAGSYWLYATVEGNVNLEGSLYVSFTVTPASLTFADFTISGGPYYQSDMPSLIGLGLVTFKGAEVSGTFTIGTVNFVAGGTSTAQVTFVPTSTNFVRTPLVATMSISLKSVATVGFGGTQYGTIENALNAAAASGGKVYVLPDVSGSVIIREDVEVASNVTLILPWGSGESDYNIASSGNFVATYNGTTTDYGGLTKLSRTLLVKVADGVTLTVNGTLTIAGELSGGGGGSAYAGHTAVKYAELELGRGANIIVNGTLHAFGKVTESATNNGSRTTVTSGAKLYQPFVLRDFLGGSRMYYIYSRGKNASTVYKRFIFMNVHSTIEYQYGSSLMACCNLYAGDQHNPTTATMIGNTTSSVIQMTSGSYIIAKYDPTSEVCDLDMYGGASLNSMSLKVKTGFLGSVTVNSANYLFPLSYHYQIKLNTLPGATSAIYTMGQNFQMLPGASLTVNQGVDLTIGKIIILDETYSDANDGTNPYPTKNPTLGESAPLFEGAKFTVHGKLTATALGGKVYADSLSCIKAITTNSFSSKDLQTAGTGGFSGSFQATRTLTAKIVVDGVEYDWPVS
ncbi:MAG: hypothetical protein IKC72_01590 [Clostridia bacterium]|nr:hypothetical protein [Clostridia bacterium]